jgi:Ca2+-binding RTX toxin-like protein
MTEFRLTDAIRDQATLILFNTPINFVNGLSVTFDFFSYGGTGADGISFFLADGSQPPSGAGGFGGSLGYAPRLKDGVLEPGLASGYLGIGFDEFGNYSVAAEGRLGGLSNSLNSPVPDAVAVRGSAATNYAYLTGTGTLSTSLDVPGEGATAEEARRTTQVRLSPTGELFISIDLDNNGSFETDELLIDGFDVVAAGNGPIPSLFQFGFAASTGDRTNIHEVGNFDVRTFDGVPIPGDFGADVSVVGSDGDDVLPSGDGNDTINAGGGNDTVDGQLGDDVIAGGDGNDTISGGDGQDILQGDTGDDLLFGGNGNDLIIGGDGINVLDGGDGDDVLISSGQGGNTLRGGPGADRFVWSGPTKRKALQSSQFPRRRRDRVEDFNANEGDRFQLDFDNNLLTQELPRRVYNVGRVDTRNLRRGALEAFTDKDRRRSGDQNLGRDEALFFQVKDKTLLIINDGNPRPDPRRDLVADVSGIEFASGDNNPGPLTVTDYFA